MRFSTLNCIEINQSGFQPTISDSTSSRARISAFFRTFIALNFWFKKGWEILPYVIIASGFVLWKNDFAKMS